MKNSSSLLLSVAWSFLLAISLFAEPSILKKGDRLDITLNDESVFEDVEVIYIDQSSIFIRSGDRLKSFKKTELRKYDLHASVKPLPIPAAEVIKTLEPASIPAQVTVAAPELTPTVVASSQIEMPVSVRSHPELVIYASLGASILALLIVCYWQAKRSRKLDVELKIQGQTLAAYSGIIELDKAVDERKRQLAVSITEIEHHQEVLAKLTADLVDLRTALSSYSAEENIVACGHYKPAYDFSNSEEYKDAIDEVRERQRGMLKNDTAATCAQTWKINGSEAEGKKATKRNLQLLLRAFNGECDAIVANVSWNNIDRMIDRIGAAFRAVNKLGESYQCSLSTVYCDLKMRELRLAFEYAVKRQKEKDEQREMRVRMRDEEKSRREMEDALKQSAADERSASLALEKARAEVSLASGDKEAALNDKIGQLEAQLAEALANKERALSRAQQTRSGHVYIISNIGSFGETVFKIGMTRRLDPYDRVDELGDASVPFDFDVHGMIYTDDAPEMESKLHQHFDNHRVNLVNERKEFFYSTIDEINFAVQRLGATVVLTKLAEAREYRETVAKKKAH